MKGFFRDSRHLESMFEYLTDSPLNKTIEENLRVNLGKKGYVTYIFLTFSLDHLEAYLRYVHQTVEFSSDIEKVELVCHLEFRGSTLFKDIHILVYCLKFKTC